MRIQVTFGLDQEDFPLYDSFLTAMRAARRARWEINGTPFEQVAPAPVAAEPEAPYVEDTQLPITAAPEAVVFSEEDVGAATLSLANKKGVLAAQAVLKQFDVLRARDLTPEQRAAYIAATKAAEAAQAA